MLDVFVGSLTAEQSEAHRAFRNKSNKYEGISRPSNFGGVRAYFPHESLWTRLRSLPLPGFAPRMEALDLLSNNLANANTSGYKRTASSTASSSLRKRMEVPGLSTTALPMIQKQWTDFKQGEIQPTGNSLDVALTGNGFLAVNGSSGALYTRNGGFKLSSSGVLITAEGYPVRSVGGGQIQATSQDPLDISPDGMVQQSGQQLGQLELVDFADPHSLTKVGNSYLRPSDEKTKALPAMGISVEQGKIETSNVIPAESAVRLVELMRQYEMLQKAISVAADMSKQATTEVAHIGS